MLDMAPRPALSVRVLTYNYGAFLEQCLESVLSQTFADFEVIVVDDGSTDDSRAIAERTAASDHRVRVESHAVNQGFVASLLHSVNLSRGRYLMQLDADDWVLDPDAFGELVGLMDADPDIAFCFSPYAVHHRDGQLSFVAPAYPQDCVLPGEIAVRRVMEFTVPHSGSIVRRSAYDAVGGYDASYTYGPDMALFYSLCAVGSVGYVNRPLIGYRNHGSGMSSGARRPAVFGDSVRAVEAVFAGPLGARIDEPRKARRQALQAFLHHHPTQQIFAGELPEGWRTFASHAKRMPVLTVVHSNTLRLAARTVLGDRLYSAMRRIHGRLSGLVTGRSTTPS